VSFALTTTTGLDRDELYATLHSQLSGVLHGERDPWANLANATALIYALLPDLNWAGVYLLRGGELVVGPFQGKPACVRIAVGRGVCGAAVAERRTQLVADVHAFPGHIACDAASNAELVVPVVAGSRLLGVLDLDSPTVGRFDARDAAGMEQAAALIAAACDWSVIGDLTEGSDPW
jgi:L-methionine (R)-S-oxide reductase